ncbi:hypothetical protein HBA55_29645 [Pseudomaricurvus alkylphenolicus]|uniref:hypothetical protein n=1 Tax=Pseudomaricurvus alkylphenolicus TaxID=1306991 RepID=UPI00142317EF|nr:hypothetical protein [Pseudomaricurvus alkylphenolicus]NIB43803.1 hypothetical protein [Pseudomaricurvus alkylphenolicus]
MSLKEFFFGKESEPDPVTLTEEYKQAQRQQHYGALIAKNQELSAQREALRSEQKAVVVEREAMEKEFPELPRLYQLAQQAKGEG